MASHTNKKRKRGPFNKAGGIHSKSKRGVKSRPRIKLTIRKRPKIILTIRKKPAVKINVSKKVLKKAIKYSCIKDNRTNKLYMFKKVPKHDGYRIVNIEKIKKGIEEITMHTVSCGKARELGVEGGNIVSMESVKENGFYTVMSFRCKGCDKHFVIENSDKFANTKMRDINVRCVWGSMVVGGGQATLNEMMGTAGVPGIDSKKYSKIEEEIGKLWKDVMEEEMMKAGEEERRLAEEEDEYFEGVPAITVICDGGWSKRSHKHSYNAMAGVGVIFGARTKKLLHIGIRNKLCYMCSRQRNKDPTPHDCYKNWNESSQSMESDIILEGFLKCEMKYGVRYMRMVGDGDSSVYASIVKNVPIWGAHVEKLECANHVTKCLRSNLEKLVSEKSYHKGKGKLSKNNIRKITSGVRCAIIMRSKEKDKKQAVKKLKLDIKNCARHVFGFHEFCSTDFCRHREGQAKDDTQTMDDQDDDGENEDVIDNQCEYWSSATKNISDEEQMILRKGGPKQVNIEKFEEVLKDVYIILNRVAEKAHRLIGNFTSNLAESWMHIRCKLDGGKTQNRCFKGSFYARCYGAALRSLFGPGWAPQVYQKLTMKVPDNVFIQTYRKRIKKYTDNKTYSMKQEHKDKRKKRKYEVMAENSTKKAKMDYGDNILCDSEDIPANELKKECDKYLNDNINNANIKHIEVITRGQSGNTFWHEERKKRITSSYFGQIIKRSVSTNSPALVKNMIYSNFKGNMYTIKGLTEEQNARTEYMNLQNKTTEQVSRIDIPGLVVCKDHPFLAASSDGIVRGTDSNDGLIEIKTLLQTKSTLIKETAKMDKSFCLKHENGKYSLNRKHNYYYQMQGQLNILEYEWCDFVIRRTNPYDMFVERIYRDSDLWNEIMVPKLRAFYLTHILPEIAVPRHHTTTGIRKPEVPWFEDSCSLKSVSVNRKSVRMSVRADVKTIAHSPKGVNQSDQIPSTSTGGPTQPSRTRERKTKFVGRRITHLWTEADGSTQWYKGLVLSVVKGRDGEKNTVYQVQYDDEDDAYDVEYLSSDLQDGSLKFIDV